uniref:Uncharacterized protein n=1 Tax=Amphilophus citrinellus TaxID=61819 RepID=A0A3Q0SBX4_AMPCI
MSLFSDNLSEALEKLKIASTDSATDSVESCLDCLLKALANSTEASMKIQEMGILPLFPTLLNPQSSCTPKVANIIAEVAKNVLASSSSGFCFCFPSCLLSESRMGFWFFTETCD